MENLIKNCLGETLDYSFGNGSLPIKHPDWVVIIGHGVTGNKDRPIVTDTADALNAAGFDTLRFSYAGNGESTGDFRDATISKEVGDLESVIDAISSKYSNVVYIGHSMGGAVGVVQAAKDNRVRALISLAGMVDTQGFAEIEFAGVIPDEGDMWGQVGCPLSTAFIRDLGQTIQNVTPLAECITIPWLLVHGTADDVVHLRDSETILALKSDSVDMTVIDGADHSFTEPAHKSAMTRAVVQWLKALT